MATPGKAPLKLTEEPEVVTWPETRYVFVEKVGPFQSTAPQAWQEVPTGTGQMVAVSRSP